MTPGYLAYKYKEVRYLPVPTNGWINGGWNNKLPQFRLLAQMLGVNSPIASADDLQDLFKRVSTAKVFAENVQPFLEATGRPHKWVVERLLEIEHKLGLLEPLPMMSLKRGIINPRSFSGVAIWPAGITNFTQLRLEQIELAMRAGAYFKCVIVLGSSRKCNAPADRRHPLIKSRLGGEELTERQLQHELLAELADDRYIEAVLPEFNADGKPLSLRQQLEFVMRSGQFQAEIQGPIYVPSTPNSLYVPLHVRRVLGSLDVCFSQAGARVVRDEMPDYWWPTLQDVKTTPNGIFRLWVELIHAGCITV